MLDDLIDLTSFHQFLSSNATSCHFTCPKKIECDNRVEIKSKI